MNGFEFGRAVLVDLLRDGPEFGARLKQRMNAEYEQHQRVFDHREMGFQKFIDFLQANEDLLVIERPDGPGAVTVRLREEAGATAPAQPEAPPRKERVRREVWQAFTNPDEFRKRYFHRPSGRVRHFLVSYIDSASRRAIESDPDYVEIPCITGDQQLSWMREYFGTLQLPEPQYRALREALTQQYSSRLNSAFTASLGDAAPGWRRKRAQSVTARVCDWAQQNSVSHEMLWESVTDARHVADRKPSTQQQVACAKSRERLDAILNLLSETDIDQFVLPFVASLVWTNSRRR